MAARRRRPSPRESVPSRGNVRKRARWPITIPTIFLPRSCAANCQRTGFSRTTGPGPFLRRSSAGTGGARAGDPQSAGPHLPRYRAGRSRLSDCRQRRRSPRTAMKVFASSRPSPMSGSSTSRQAAKWFSTCMSTSFRRKNGVRFETAGQRHGRYGRSDGTGGKARRRAQGKLTPCGLWPVRRAALRIGLSAGVQRDAENPAGPAARNALDLGPHETLRPCREDCDRARS